MKKNLFITTMALLSAAIANAQWNTDANFIKISDEYPNGVPLVRAARADNGQTFLAWAYLNEGWANEGLWQVLDNEGNIILDEEGLSINNTWAPRQVENFCVTTDDQGNAIFLYPDARDDEANYYNKPYLYKVDAHGNNLWREAGIALPTATESAQNTTLYQLDDNYFVTYSFMDYNTNTQTTYLVKVAHDGSIAWDGVPKQMPGSYGSLVASGNSLLYFYLDESKVMAQAYDADGQTRWEAPVLLSGDYSVQPAWSGSTIRCLDDGQGGSYVYFEVTNENWQAVTLLQHINAQGQLLMGDTPIEAVSKGIGEAYQKATVLGQTPGAPILFVWNGGDWSGAILMATLIDSQGNKLWADKQLDTAASGIFPVYLQSSQSSIMLFYQKATDWATQDLAVASVNIDNGETAWAQTLFPSMGTPDSFVGVKTPDGANIFWAEVNLETYATFVAAFRIFNDGSFVEDMGETGIAAIGNAEQPLNAVGTSLFDMTGRKISALQHGVNIVRSSEGITHKVVVK